MQSKCNFTSLFKIKSDSRWFLYSHIWITLQTSGSPFGDNFKIFCFELLGVSQIFWTDCHLQTISHLFLLFTFKQLGVAELVGITKNLKIFCMVVQRKPILADCIQDHISSVIIHILRAWIRVSSYIDQLVETFAFFSLQLVYLGRPEQLPHEC